MVQYCILQHRIRNYRGVLMLFVTQQTNPHVKQVENLKARFATIFTTFDHTMLCYTSPKYTIQHLIVYYILYTVCYILCIILFTYRLYYVLYVVGCAIYYTEFCIVFYPTGLCYTILRCYMILYHTIRYCTMRYYTILYDTILYYVIVYYTEPYYSTPLCNTVLRCTILSYPLGP